MLTNIIQESTELLCCGNGAREQVLEAFDLSDDIEEIMLKGVVSRKKQIDTSFCNLAAAVGGYRWENRVGSRGI